MEMQEEEKQYSPYPKLSENADCGQLKYLSLQLVLIS